MTTMQVSAANARSPAAWNRLVACLLVLLPAVYLLFFHRLGDRDLWSSHEARAGQDARVILADGMWLVPRLFDGRWELQKPPLYYWMVAAFARLRGSGVDAWDVRLPAALAAAGCVGSLLWFGWMRGRLVLGLAAAAALATMVHFTWLARIARVDMPLTLAVSVSLLAFYLARHRPGRARIPLLATAYAALATAGLFKGPIGLLLPAAVVAVWLFVEAESTTWRGRFIEVPRLAFRELGLLWGGLAVVGVTATWFLAANDLTGGELFRVFVWHHNVERGLGGSRLREHPWWFYGPQFLGDALPWSLFLVAGAWWCCRHRLWQSSPDLRFGAVWFLTIVVALSCSKYKRADYLLPAYPGAALVLAGAVCSGGASRRLLTGGGVVAAATVVGWLVRVDYQLPAQEPFRDYRGFAAVVRGHAPTPAPVLFFRTEAHALAFHVGRPLDVLVQWPDLRDQLHRAGPHFVILPPAALEEWADALPGVTVVELARNTDPGGRHERPLVLVRVDP